MVDDKQLQDWLSEAVAPLAIPGAAAAVYHAGEEQYAAHGVTSVENPLPVDRHTLVGIGSTGKTFTATAIVRLVEQGAIDLDSRAREYVPDLRLKDAAAADQVTILHLLNHTAGWEGDLDLDTGDGDDALARYVEAMAELDQHAAPGAAWSYNNAAFSLAGHVIEQVTGRPFERAAEKLVLRPLGLRDTAYFPNDIMTRRFTVGHAHADDGSVAVVRPRVERRSGRPAGVGLVSSAADQIAWARFHMGDGRAADGTRVLSEEWLRRMQQPSVETPGGAQGDAVGLSWLLREVDGVRLIMHGGDGEGHHSAFAMVPERDFAVTLLTNGPDGPRLRDDILRWALETYAGVVDRAPEPVQLEADALAEYVGAYETGFLRLEVTSSGGGLRLELAEKARPDDGDVVVDAFPPLLLGMLPGGDRYVVTDGPHMGVKGYFTRDAAGEIDGMHFGGRMAFRIGARERVA